MFDEKQLKIAKANAEAKAKVSRAYLQLSREEYGKTILDDLADFCNRDRSSVCEASPNNDQTNFNEGKRRVWLRINGLITEAKNGLD